MKNKNYFKKASLGARFSPEDKRDFKIAAAGIQQDFPAAYSLEDISPLPAVKDQGNISSCVAHATSSIVEWFYEKETGLKTETSTDFIYGGQKFLNYENSDEGMYLRDACKIVAQLGDVEYDFCPGNHTVAKGAYANMMKAMDSHEALHNLRNYKIKSYVRCNNDLEIKQALINGSPILAAVEWFLPCTVNEDNTVNFYGEKAQSMGGHAIMLYGWNEKGFLFQNSWGEKFGEEGRAILPYAKEDTSRYTIKEAWALVDQNNYDLMWEAGDYDFKVSSVNYSNSPLINGTINSPNYTNRYNTPIRKLTIHHMAGVSSAKAVGEIFANPSRAGSSNYGIGKDGEIYLYVPEQYRAWTSGSWDNDSQAVTIEVSNSSTGGDWPVSDKVYERMIELCIDVCKRNNIQEINYTGNTSGNLTKHKWFQATACPGPYLSDRFKKIADEINENLKGEVPMTKEERAEFDSLKKEVKGLSDQVAPVYNSLEQVPDWGYATIAKLIKKGYLKGEKNGDLKLSYQMIRIFVVEDRMGLFD